MIKRMMRVHIFMVFSVSLMMFLFILVGCTPDEVIPTPEPTEETDSIALNKARIYESYKDTATIDFTENHPFYQVFYNDRLFGRGLKSIIEETEVVIIFIGFATCPACQVHIGAFERYFYSEGMDQYTNTFYYHNIVADQEGYEAFISDYEHVSGTVPQLMVFKNGVFVMAFSPISANNLETINASVRDFFRAVKIELDQ